MVRPVLIVFAVIAVSAPSFARSLEKRAPQFKTYLGFLDYSIFMTQKAPDNDKLPPRCNRRRLTGRAARTGRGAKCEPFTLVAELSGEPWN